MRRHLRIVLTTCTRPSTFGAAVSRAGHALFDSAYRRPKAHVTEGSS
jgi:hypothetical protein